MSEIMIIPLEYIERENVYVLCEHDNSSMDRETCAVAQVLRMLMGVHHTILFRERSLLPTRPPNRQDIIQGVGCTNQGIL